MTGNGPLAGRETAVRHVRAPGHPVSQARSRRRLTYRKFRASATGSVSKSPPLLAVSNYGPDNTTGVSRLANRVARPTAVSTGAIADRTSLQARRRSVCPTYVACNEIANQLAGIREQLGSRSRFGELTTSGRRQAVRSNGVERFHSSQITNRITGRLEKTLTPRKDAICRSSASNGSSTAWGTMSSGVIVNRSAVDAVYCSENKGGRR